MASTKSKEKNHSSFFGAIGMGAAAGAFVGAAVVIAYGLTVVSSAGATLAARAALMGALGGVAASIGMRHKQRKTEKALDEKEDQLQIQQKEIVELKIEVALAKQREGERRA